MIQFARMTLASMLCLGSMAAMVPSASADFIPVFSTGTTSTGALAAQGGADANYTLVSAPAGAPTTATVGTSIPSVWTGNTSSSQWIGPEANLNTANPIGSYDYRTSFTLASNLSASTVAILGQIAADDYVSILVNGVQEYNNYGTFRNFSSFALTSGFTAGANTIDFIVTNAPNVGPSPTGLQVNVTSATATANAVVPEPASVVMVSLGGMIAAGFGLRRRRATA